MGSILTQGKWTFSFLFSSLRQLGKALNYATLTAMPQKAESGERDVLTLDSYDSYGFFCPAVSGIKRESLKKRKKNTLKE